MLKNKKNKKNVKKGQISKKTDAEYEQEVAELNAILAEGNREVESVEKRIAGYQAKYDKERKDFSDIKEFLNYQVQVKRLTVLPFI